MSKAEEFRNEYAKNLKFEDWDYLWAYLHEKCGIKNDLPTHHLNKVMEAYHQSEVNAISDEEIEKEFSKIDCHKDYEMDEKWNNDNKIRGAKWFKNKLLKQ